MNVAGRLAGAVTEHSRAAIAVMLLLTVLVGAGAPMVESTSSLDQFQTESEESEKLEYVQTNFSADDNATTAQIVVRGDDVLSQESLLSMLRYQQELRANETIEETLVDGEPIGSVASAVARTAIGQEQAGELQRRGENLTVQREVLAADQQALEQRGQALNETTSQLRSALTALRENPSLETRTAFDRVRDNGTSANATVELDEDHFRTFDRAAGQLRNASSESEIEAAYELGTQGVLQPEFAALENRSEELAARGDRLQQRADELAADREAIEEREAPTLDEQITKLESMNDSEIREAVAAALDGNRNGGAGGPLALMPSTYEPGATEANATMIAVTQTSDVGNVQGAASEATVDAQLAMRDVASGLDDDLDYAVFGAGIISEEINASMTDSLVIVGPLALLFVLIALTVAYRDPLDIALGLLGIGGVLLWTFGFMGWADIDFNQIFVAVPVLLIGLSIDYAIHVFMRHREERQSLSETAPDGGSGESGPRRAMFVALGGVGIALVWVTATTVIGFLSNLTSPVPPIREFGVVASAGIVAALLLFGILIPALKVEFDELLESRGVDRTKRAFGTGGGRFSSALSVGAAAARRAPYVVILLVVVLSVVGAYGGTQVSTEFQQEDFLADDPPAWMEELPEPFEPGEYTAKSTLSFVNDRFVREDSQTELLIEGNVTGPDTLERVDAAREAASGKNVTQELPTGAPAIRSPLSVMRSVSATNETFNATLAAADTDGDGIPDRNLTAVYDGLYDAAPEEARQYVYRSGGEYRALRMSVSIDGGADGEAITEQMRSVADGLDGDGLQTTATGQAVLNKIVQDQLLETVVESLIVSLVAVFLFLMVTYRVSEGSATLGAVTLLPVAFAVAWILGSMLLLEIPFNVITGMITSLTIGLGVAYSIHLSERYTQELERSETVWEAMETAVTGTGGALLGSAATTVGGFGVLVFSILPPLQQFGFITGLSIVYAFLGSVFVLPSLLVVWTRYAGPSWAREQIAGGGTGTAGDTTADESAAGQAAAGGASTGQGSLGPADGVGSSAALANGRGRAVRRIDHEHVRAGQEILVRITVDDADGRVGVRETFDGAAVAVQSVEPEPASVAAHGTTVYAVWELDDEPAELTYAATVPAAATDAETFVFDGTVLTAGEDADVGGDDHVRVVADLFERVLARGEVTDDDLAAAEERLAAGELTEAQFERIYRTWLGEPATSEIEGGER